MLAGSELTKLVKMLPGAPSRFASGSLLSSLREVVRLLILWTG